MLKHLPAAIRSTFWKYTLLSITLSAVGLIWALAQGDAVLLLLSAAIAILGGWRSLHLFQIINSGKYRIIEGVILMDRKQPFRSCHVLTMKCKDGSDVQELIAGSTLLAPGRHYRIYLHYPMQPEIEVGLPDALKPAQAMLGYELLDK